MTDTNNTNNVNSAAQLVCPVCNKVFENIHDFAFHMKQHSEDIKRREAEEKKQRKADQKKVDAARLEKLKKIYEDASSNYIKAKEKYIDDYDERPGFDLWDDLAKALHDNWSNWF